MFFTEFNKIILAPITPIEISSVFNRLLREKNLTSEAAQESISEWEKEQQFFLYTGFNSDLIHSSIMVIESTGMKTLDAIQLASASISHIDKFVTADKALFKAAEKVLNVEAILIT